MTAFTTSFSVHRPVKFMVLPFTHYTDRVALQVESFGGALTGSKGPKAREVVEQCPECLLGGQTAALQGRLGIMGTEILRA